MGLYVVMTAQEKMPDACMGAANYRRIALVELDPVEFGKRRLLGKDPIPSRIDERMKLVKAIPFNRRRLYKGNTDRCAYARAMEDLQNYCDNNQINPIAWR